MEFTVCPAENIIINQIDFVNMTADAKAKFILKASFTCLCLPLHKKIATLVGKDKIGDNLFECWILFHDRAWVELFMLFDELSVVGIVYGFNALPGRFLGEE